MKKFYIIAGEGKPAKEIVTDREPEVPYYIIKAWNKEAAIHVVAENLKRIPEYYR